MGLSCQSLVLFLLKTAKNLEALGLWFIGIRTLQSVSIYFVCRWYNGVHCNKDSKQQIGQRTIYNQEKFTVTITQILTKQK